MAQRILTEQVFDLMSFAQLLLRDGGSPVCHPSPSFIEATHPACVMQVQSAPAASQV